MNRLSAETFAPGEYIANELAARGWSTADLAQRMGGDPVRDQCAVELLVAVRDKRLALDAGTAFGLAKAFDVSPRFFLNLDRVWRGQPMLVA